MRNLLLMSAAVTALALGSAHAADLKFTPGEGNFNWESYEALKATQLNGEEVTVFGPWLGPDQENVEAVLAYFAEATGADVKYVGSDSFEQQIVIDAEAGSAPNVAVFPQPGLAADMAKRVEIGQKLNTIIFEKGGMIPLVHRGRLSAHANTLGGVDLNVWDSELWNIADWHRAE